jgi:hypothetical protein
MSECRGFVFFLGQFLENKFLKFFGKIGVQKLHYGLKESISYKVDVFNSANVSSHR